MSEPTTPMGQGEPDAPIPCGDAPVVRDLIRVGTQELRHRYMGSCPDYTQPEMRDPLCAACKAIKRAEKDLTRV